MKFALNKNGFLHHHIQSGNGSPQKSVSGLRSCDMSVPETKTARFPEENRAVSKPVIQEKCLWAAKNVCQCEKSGKACKCAQSDAPAGFLSGFFHDYSSYSLSGGSSRPGPLSQAFIKIRRRRQMQKAAK
ncbi:MULTISPECIES: hypothetical protein [Agrobacterium]|jgi:hypothetical protein|uniref:Uncharacterized protein n=2 Tax=Agrobacterium salinitolerans TaxID=1183413 RepID=A0A9X3KKZ7_9HYPH|nr:MULTISPECIES: hypothetical protein [Agrobacterium]MBA4776331.1 hypothetical protein [Hyphomicrobiales bacterium]MCZ7854854.1 hypothetical protein [Agrobacterium salinitolerans]MCZ7865893.1 hypothetical protein [Agrobacterium salinitolerans]MCZ7936600.1 hypothetical protein [Agrobacterium salinitolerans]MCZ7977162.1 hypothetical protein [Agrobacterium salinitolerans]